MPSVQKQKLLLTILFIIIASPILAPIIPLILGGFLLFKMKKLNGAILFVVLMLTMALQVLWIFKLKDPVIDYVNSHPEILGTNTTSEPEKTPQEEKYKITRVIDGDTIELENGQTVRYIGINTPETKHPTKGVECFGKEAAAKNTELVLDKTAILVKDVNNTDRYGRLLRYVYVDGIFINEELVKTGFAYASSYPPDVKNDEILRNAQRIAQENKSGLWKECQVEK